MSRRACALLVGGLLLALAACGASPGPSGDPDGVAAEPGAGWQRVEGFPLSARTDPILAWTGSEVVVVGGNTGWICPPNADCTSPTDLASDGAAWDPARRTWRRIADAPVDLLAGWYCQPCAATVGGRVVVDAGDLDGPRWLSYDPASDAWQRLATPDADIDLAQHDGTRIWGFRGKQVVSWEPITGDVRVEATYDVERPLDDRALVLTDRGPVVTGVRYGDAAPDEPTLAQVDVPTPDGGWRRLATEQLGWLRHWTGEVLIGVEAGSADGGEVDGWDRAYPYAGALDPETGTWQPVDVPAGERDAWPVSAEAGPLVVTGGQFVDVRRLEWTSVGRPDSRLDTQLSSTWAGGSLFVVGGVDEERGYESPSDPEAWLWTPPAG